MEQLKGILNAFIELIEKLVGDNESLKGIIDTLKKYMPQGMLNEGIIKYGIKL